MNPIPVHRSVFDTLTSSFALSKTGDPAHSHALMRSIAT